MSTVGENRALRDQYNAAQRQLAAVNDRYITVYNRYTSSGPNESLLPELKSIESEARSLASQFDSLRQQNSSGELFDPTLGKMAETRANDANKIANDSYTGQSNITRELAAVAQNEKTVAANETADAADDDEGDDEELSEEEKQNLDNPPGDDNEETEESNTGFDEQDEQDADNPRNYGEQTDPGDMPGGSVSSSDSTGTKESVGKTTVPVQIPVTNPLHDYASYTYNVSLFVLTPSEYNNAMKNKNARWNQIGKCMIGGAGRYNSDSSRAEQFRDDFYFDNLRIQTVIGLNARSKSSNAIDFSFTIIEPYGLTLLDRIIDYAHNSGVKTKDGKTPNYLEFPYFLKVDFFGATDDGTMPTPIPNQSKYFPIKLVGFKMKVGTRGTEYNIQAVPFNHTALQENVASCPVNLEIDAKTVGDFFDIGQVQSIDLVEKRELIRSFELAVDDPDVRANPAALEIYKNQLETLKKELKVKSSSYTAGVNDWYNYQIDTGARVYADIIEFIVDPKIAKTNIVLQDHNDHSKTPVPDPNTVKAKVVNKPNATGPDFTKGVFSVSAGTSVLRMIDMVMRNSTYVLDQVADPASSSPQAIADKREKPLNWYKVVPSVELLEFDPKSNRWAKKLTYHIKEHIVYNSKHPMGPQSIPKGHVKVYNYIYTGANSDIIDFNIDFDALYFTAVSVNRGTHTTISGSPNPEERTNKPNAVINPAKSRSLIQPVYVGVPDNPAANAALDGNRDSSTKTAASIQTSIYSSARGDMLNLKLKIVGDPHFIKQDDILVNPADPDYDKKTSTQLIEGVGSLGMDRGEIFAQVNFFTPVDMDDETGLTRVDGKFAESSFSGTYKVVRVENEFRNGKFEQTLDMVRIFKDIIPAPSKKSRPKQSPVDSDARSSAGDSEDWNDQDAQDADNPRDYGEQTDPGDMGWGEQTDPGDINYEDTDLNPGISSYGEEDDPYDPDTVDEFDYDVDQEDEELIDLVDTDDEVNIDDYNEELDNSAEDTPVETAGQYDQRQALADSSTATNDPVTGPVTTNTSVVQTVDTTETTGGGVTTRTADTTSQPTQESLIQNLEYDIFEAKRSLAFFTRRGNLAKVAELNAKLAQLESELMKARG